MSIYPFLFLWEKWDNWQGRNRSAEGNAYKWNGQLKLIFKWDAIFCSFHFNRHIYERPQCLQFNTSDILHMRSFRGEGINYRKGNKASGAHSGYLWGDSGGCKLKIKRLSTYKFMRHKRTLEVEVGHCPFLLSIHIHTAWYTYLLSLGTQELSWENLPRCGKCVVFFSDEQFRNVWANVSAAVTVTSSFFPV